PAVPAKTVPEFIAYAKANPRKISFASSGVGSPLHVAGELFKMMAGVDMVHVPFRGSAPALPDLLGGQVQGMFDLIVSSMRPLRAGRLRARAWTSATRSTLLPDVPTGGDYVPGFEATGWAGIVAPANPPADVIARLNKEINAGLADPRIKARLAELGATSSAS